MKSHGGIQVYRKAFRQSLEHISAAPASARGTLSEPRALLSLLPRAGSGFRIFSARTPPTRDLAVTCAQQESGA